MLSDEDRMPSVGRLPSVISWCGRSEPLPDQFCRVLSNRGHASLIDHRALFPFEAELRTEALLTDPAQPRIEFICHHVSQPRNLPLCAARAGNDRHEQHTNAAGYATAVPSSSTIWPGTARRVTPSIVVVGETPAAPSRPARTP